MQTDDRIRNLKSMVWGLFLMAVGSVFLADRLGYVEVPHISQLWPLVFVVIGALHFAEGRPGSAISMLLFGAWFLACTTEWHGLTWSNSWPLALVAGGTGIVVRALTGEDERCRRKKEERHG